MFCGKLILQVSLMASIVGTSVNQYILHQFFTIFLVYILNQNIRSKSYDLEGNTSRHRKGPTSNYMPCLAQAGDVDKPIYTGIKCNASLLFRS